MWLGTGFASTSELFNAGCLPRSNQQQRLAVLLREQDPTLHDQSSVMSEDLLHAGQLLWTIYRNGIEDFGAAWHFLHLIFSPSRLRLRVTGEKWITLKVSSATCLKHSS